MLDSPIHIGAFTKNSREHIRAELRTFHDKDLVDLRVMVPGDDGRPVATKQGLCVRVELLPQLAELIAKAMAEARARGLLAPDTTLAA